MLDKLGEVRIEVAKLKWLSTYYEELTAKPDMGEVE